MAYALVRLHSGCLAWEYFPPRGTYAVGVLEHATKGATVEQKISVLVQIDLNAAYVRLVVTGCLTAASQQALCPLVRRAHALLPSATVTVDLTGATHVESAAVDLLRWDAEHEAMRNGRRPAQLLLPTPPWPAHPLDVPDNPHHQREATPVAV